MKGYFFLRDIDGHNYLVPEDMAEDFNRLTNILLNTDEDSDEFASAIDEFSAKFEYYIWGRSLSKLKFFLPEHRSHWEIKN